MFISPQALEDAGRFMRAQCTGNEKPQLLLVFLPNNAADCRRYVKFWGDMVADVSTQCVVCIGLIACIISTGE